MEGCLLQLCWIFRVPDSVVNTCFESGRSNLEVLDRSEVSEPVNTSIPSIGNMLLDAERKFENRDVQLNQVYIKYKLLNK